MLGWLFPKRIVVRDGTQAPKVKKKKKVKNTKGLWDSIRALRAEGFRPTKIEISKDGSISWSIEYVEKAPSKAVREKKEGK